jgi:predicted nucleotidyltransferase
MPASINQDLWNLSKLYYISYGSKEQIKIDASVDGIKTKLTSYFGKDLFKIIEFGSYRRDTLLPRQFDPHSDVDLMLIFNHASLDLTPGTYRTRLLKFVEEKYPRSKGYRDSPTVVLELDHINYDLVPGYEQSYPIGFHNRLFIPASNSRWQETNPNDFNQELTTANGRHNYIIKPLIRLVKAANAKADYPLSTYELEQHVARTYYLGCSTLQDYFFRSIESLPEPFFGNVTAASRIQAIKATARRVKQHLDQDNLLAAHAWLKHILPL